MEVSIATTQKELLLIWLGVSSTVLSADLFALSLVSSFRIMSLRSEVDLESKITCKSIQNYIAKIIWEDVLDKFSPPLLKW